MSHGNTIKIFAERELKEYLGARIEAVKQSIESEKDDYILNVNENDYIAHKISLAEVEHLEIHEEQICVSTVEKMIPAEYFPNSFRVERGQSYKKDVIKFHIPFTGNSALLRCYPNYRILWTTDIEIRNDEFCFEIINFTDEAEKIVQQKDEIVQKIKNQYVNIKSEIDRYNFDLQNQIKSVFESRKNRIKVKTGILASLGVPIKKASLPSDTFSIPSPQKRRQISLSKPEVRESNFTPEPSLDESIYRDILRMIHDVGKTFERLPSLYSGKEEEHLRDHFLMILEPNFEGAATGETFNKTGKTDILLRYEGINVFIGECKFWKGEKSFLNTISQLLGYLTWRDSKAAVIMFVTNKEFTKVISTAKSCIGDHSNYLRSVSESDETFFNYEFHLDGDRNRVVKVAVMFYHIPRIS